ncbi:YggS family pyridoxal phosphate-dependent enzyme [Stackebrandtia nassauensis]|uniref:Pyridoxal phosphate homeostasis protein n=1 Tax=Stackebrandtia nassauensis (strain DSM 44728 / CIP 108903 / NRRL B-16338 / NBRC 102104 / LLR-40K-21) TaxID=446470 RepID=D3PZX2_STANL|nr:YggS family pyridoxal phosphate-dependent enzyme [Stackebrandtia nassauensis]ADD43659.1 alanine racemase domain protein [Stackebrandtia nassauensis DSM 44728]
MSSRSTGTATKARRAQLAENLRATRADIAAACEAAGRDPSGVELVVVSKTHPAADVCALAELGVRGFGENRDQEAAAKAAEVAASGTEVRWHFVGRLQRNKCRSVVSYASMVESVDRSSLVTALDAEARSQRDSPLDVLMQLSVDSDTARGGVAEADDEALAAQILACQGLRLRGVMAVAPLGWEPGRAFEAVARRAAKIQALAPNANIVSAGMSADYAEAISFGATEIRLGSKLLGRRDDLRYAFETK